MEVEAAEILEILYRLPICTVVAVMVELVEVCTLTRVGSQHPQIHMDLLLLNPMDLPNLIRMVPHPSHMVPPLLNHMVLPHLNLTDFLLLLLKFMGLRNLNQFMVLHEDLLVVHTDRRNLVVEVVEERIMLK
jgi:hypothetical protein